jgi:hypothetical protein
MTCSRIEVKPCLNTVKEVPEGFKKWVKDMSKNKDVYLSPEILDFDDWIILDAMNSIQNRSDKYNIYYANVATILMEKLYKQGVNNKQELIG